MIIFILPHFSVFVLSPARRSYRPGKIPSTFGTIVPVPLHGKSKPIPKGTLFAIIKQSKIPKNEFR